MSFQKLNGGLADQLNRLADLSEIAGTSFWSIRAYRGAANTIAEMDVPISSVADFTALPGVGKGLAKKIKEYLTHGYIIDLAELENQFPIEALSMTVVPGIGPKTAFKYYHNGIRNFDELVKAAEAGKIKNENILRGIKLAVRSRGRLPLNEVLPVVFPILNALRASPEVIRAEFAGSVRRRKETIKDVDILVVSSNRAATIKLFQMFGEELVNGEDKSRIIAPVDAHTSVQVDLLFAPPEEFGSALAYFTGSKEHNVSLRALAQSRGMKINEHGFWTLTGQRLGGENEEELYQLLDLPFVPPELREGSDLQDEIPNLISRDDLTADWHMHTFWSSDAKDSFESMAQSAKNRGLKEIGISDHTERQYGWDPTRNSIRREEAQLASQKIGIPIWVGCETGINMDGSLDWSDDYLNEMDYVIASIHKSHQHNVTERLISAAKHPKVKIIGHPTGRILGKREIPDVDWGRVFQTCAEEGVAVEINGARMDLPDNFVRQARSLGCKFIINSDAHAQDQLEWQDYGLDIARRAGLSKQDLMTPKLK